MCTEFPLGGKAGRRDPCDGGCRLGWRPKDKVLHVWRSVGNQSVLHCSTLVCDAGNSTSIPAESKASAISKGCIESLHVKHLLNQQTARPFKVEVWTDSSSAKALVQRLGPGRRAKHLEVQTMRVQQLNMIGHLVEQVKYAGKCSRFADETRSKSSTRRAGRNDGLHVS